MSQADSAPSARPALPDLLTLIAISALAYIAATALHEHVGHGLACILQGSTIKEAGAFYVDCDRVGLTDLGMRFVALAGPVVSLLTGLIGFIVLARLPSTASTGRYFTWMLATIGLMAGMGYMMFSGLTGAGDLGTSPDGLIYQLQPDWLYQVILIVLGVAGYVGVILFSVRNFDGWIGGAGTEKVRYARNLTLITYFSGAVASVLIGLLNPHGLEIVLISAVASSMGATSGFLWMMQLLNRKKESSGPYLTWGRRWNWIAVSAVFLIAYAAIFGPTLYGAAR
jgi:hypothetical protein